MYALGPIFGAKNTQKTAPKTVKKCKKLLKNVKIIEKSLRKQ